MGDLDEVLRGYLELESAHAGTDKDVVELFGCGVDVGGKGFLHADGAASATNVAGEWQQLLLGYEVALLVARHFGSFLEVHFLSSGNDTHKMSATIPFQHKCLENLAYVLVQLVGNMLCPQVGFFHLVGN